jgi:hypothetical protein
MFVIQNIKNKKFVTGIDKRYNHPRLITSHDTALTFGNYTVAKAFRCGQDYKIVEAEIKIKEPKAIMNPRKLQLLNEKIKQEKYYTIEIIYNKDNDKISIEVINNARKKKIKPYWVYNKKKQLAIKMFCICHKNVSLHYSEEELYKYANELKKEGF